MPHITDPNEPYFKNGIWGWATDQWRRLSADAAGRLQVRGEDQLFSFRGVLANDRSAVVNAANGYVDSHACPAGEIWCVTNLRAFDQDNATTRHRYLLHHDGASYGFGETVADFAFSDPSYWHPFVWLDQGDTIRIYFQGALATNTCTIHLTGYRMTLEV